MRAAVLIKRGDWGRMNAPMLPDWPRSVKERVRWIAGGSHPALRGRRALQEVGRRPEWLVGLEGERISRRRKGVRGMRPLHHRISRPLPAPKRGIHKEGGMPL